MRHPDANLLSSFFERTLSDREYQQVMGHLGQCQQCRKLVMLAFPLQETAAGISPVLRRAEHRWQLPRLLTTVALRWAAVGALGVVVVGVALYLPRRSGSRLPQTNREEASPTAPSATSSDVDSAENFAPVVPPKESIRQPATEAAKSAELGAAAPKRQSYTARRFGEGSIDAPAREQKPQDTFRAAGGPLQLERAPKTKKAAKANVSSTSLSAALLSKSPAVPAPASEQPASLPVQALANTKGQAKKQIMAETLGDKFSGGRLRADRGAQLMVQPPSRQLRSRMEEEMVALVPEKGKEAPKTITPGPSALAGTGLGGSPPEQSALWSITSPARGDTAADGTSPDPSSRPFVGRIQRSVDRGKTWEELHVDDSVSFRAVYASGPNVWAGGSSRALYHSSDQGTHWRRVVLGPQSSGTSDTIVEVDFSDSQHGRIKTDANETWTSSDGGLHWQKRRY
jgi:hypothetical protein